MDDDPDLEPDVADEVENTKKQRVSLSPEPSSSKVLPGDSEECDVCRNPGATCTPIIKHAMNCQSRRIVTMAVVLGKIREFADSTDYPPPTPRHGSMPTLPAVAHTSPSGTPKPPGMPTATIWDKKTAKQDHSPPKKSPLGTNKAPNPSKDPRAPTTPGLSGPKLGTFHPTGKPTFRAIYPNNDFEAGTAQKDESSDVNSEETNQEDRKDSQATDDNEALIKDIQQPRKVVKLVCLEPDSKVARDQAMVGSTHATQTVALLNSFPGKQQAQTDDQLAEPVRVRRTTEELEAARNLGG